MIVTVANRKGGVGKTTTSVFLAHALAEATGASCALIDADPQASAAQWAQRAADAGHLLSVPVLAQPTPKLAQTVPDTQHVVIDTPPADLDIIAAAIELADLVVVPTSASALDLSLVPVTVEAAARSGKPAAVLLTSTRRTRSIGAAEDSLRDAGVRVLRARIALREALAMAFGQPVRQLHGYELVAAELLGALPDQPYSVEAVRQRVASTQVGHNKANSPRLHRAVLTQQFAAQVAHRPRPISSGDDEIVQRLRASMARLANQR
ncbi:MAG TPA: ParA family protein [Jatrophihabitans sp.]|nr:ParA family protein [Jatrophihabitans sp.]